MIEKVMPGIFRVPVPLFDNPLHATNSYILKGRNRHLVIDTGMNRKECREALYAAFAELEIKFEEADYFITHLHVDHLELAYKIASAHSKVFFNRPDAEIIYDEGSWDSVIDFARRNGFPTSELQHMVQAFSKSVSTFESGVDFTLLQEGDKISVGDYEFTCLETPGHTPGSMCLYEAGEKFLFSGDHILEEVTPNISLLMEEELNPLKSYLESLNKVLALDLEQVLPGHRGVIKTPHQRIKELQHHHRKREEEVLAILSEAPANGYEIASRMSWELAQDWDDFPTFQRWFATGEALAHLKYLESKDMVGFREEGDKVLFFASLS